MGASEEQLTMDLTASEKELLKPFFSNVDKDVFVLTNLPEVVKGTLFSRYSRSDKSVRRILLDEFIPNKDVLALIEANKPGQGFDSAVAINKAEDFYQRILVGYGDDSVAELAGVHVACENVSSIVGDYLTDSRIGISPLEKSARYVLFDKKVNGKYLWYRDPNIMASSFADEYAESMDSLFDHYCKWIPIVKEHIKQLTPKEEGTTDRAYDSAIRAKACDVLKNLLPAGRLTNLGLHGNGRAFEYLLTKLYSNEMPEARVLAAELHAEFSKVIPSFVKRAQASEYINETRAAVQAVASSMLPHDHAQMSEPYIKLIDYDSAGEEKVIAAMLYTYTLMPMDKLREMVKAMGTEKRKEVIAAYLSKRRNRRDKAGRALENTYYTFEICTNYGAFRDIHRHRVLTMERQRLTTDLGFDVPKELGQIGLEKEYIDVMKRTAEVQKRIEGKMPIEAQYLVPRGFRIRWYMTLNLREIHHLTELRSMKQGHPDYRKLAQRLKLEVEKVHPSLVQHTFVDMNDYALARMESEKKIDERLARLDKEASERNAR